MYNLYLFYIPSSNPPSNQRNYHKQQRCCHNDHANHDLLVLPPHFPPHCLRCVSHIIWLIRDSFRFLHQDLDLLPSLNHFVHVFKCLLLQFWEFLSQRWELVDFGWVVVVSHGRGQKRNKIFQRVGYSRIPFGGLVFLEKLLLDFLEERHGNPGLILLKSHKSIPKSLPWPKTQSPPWCKCKNCSWQFRTGRRFWPCCIFLTPIVFIPKYISGHCLEVALETSVGGEDCLAAAGDDGVDHWHFLVLF